MRIGKTLLKFLGIVAVSIALGYAWTYLSLPFFGLGIGCGMCWMLMIALPNYAWAFGIVPLLILILVIYLPIRGRTIGQRMMAFVRERGWWSVPVIIGGFAVFAASVWLLSLLLFPSLISMVESDNTGGTGFALTIWLVLLGWIPGVLGVSIYSVLVRIVNRRFTGQSVQIGDGAGSPAPDL